MGGETGKNLVLPRGDALDGTITKLAVPAVLNFLILPLVGTVDTLWVGKLGDPTALAALGAANQVFSSIFLRGLLRAFGRHASGGRGPRVR